MLKLKPGVSLRGIRPEMAVAAQVVAEAFKAQHMDCTITSGTEGTHGRGSLHYQGAALDFRTRGLDYNDRLTALVTRIKQALGDDFDVVLEATHLHVEFQPKVPARV